MDAPSVAVLIVDDEQRLRDLMRGYLARERFSVLTAADGLTALDLARQHVPDVVVLDLMLHHLRRTAPAGGCAPSPTPT